MNFSLLDPDPRWESGSRDPFESGSNPDPQPKNFMQILRYKLCYLWTEKKKKIWRSTKNYPQVFVRSGQFAFRNITVSWLNYPLPREIFVIVIFKKKLNKHTAAAYSRIANECKKIKYDQARKRPQAGLCLGLHSYMKPVFADPDPNVFGSPGSGSISQRYGSVSFYYQAQIVRKTLIPNVLWLLLWLFIFENLCKCTFKN
jgi:hypothetical protein